MNMILSIIVPVYQGEQYIEKCIESLIHQVEKGVELILIDDGSKDDSWHKILSYSEKYGWIKAIHHENRGVSFTRNQGIKYASGEYVWFVDADDTILPNSIKDIFHIIQLYNPDIIVFGYRSKLSRKWLNEFDTIPMVVNGIYSNDIFKDNFWNIYSQNLIHNIGTKIYKKEKIIENEICFEEKLQIFEDALFCTSVLQRVDNIYICNKVWYCYNLEINRNSLSHGYKRNFLYGINCLFNKFKEILPLNRNFYYFYLCSLQDVIENEFKKSKHTFFAFRNNIKSIQHEEMYCDAVRFFPEVLSDIKFWNYIQKKKYFRAYLKARKDVIKKYALGLPIANHLFDITYALYYFVFKWGKEKNEY